MTYPQQQHPAQQYPTQRQAPAVPAAPVPSANDALMGGGGPSHPGVQFQQPGDGVRNAVVLAFESRQERAFVPPRADGTTVPWHERAPLFFPGSGDPIYGVVITVQTTDRLGPEDDGKRSLFIEGKGKKATLRDAIRAAGASGLEVGAVIDFVFTHSENPADRQARKHYSARYVPAAQAGANAALGVAPSAPQPQQAPQYQPTPAPASPWAPGAYPQQQAAPQAPAAAPVAPGAVPPWVTQG